MYNIIKTAKWGKTRFAQAVCFSTNLDRVKANTFFGGHLCDSKYSNDRSIKLGDLIDGLKEEGLYVEPLTHPLLNSFSNGSDGSSFLNSITHLFVSNNDGLLTSAMGFNDCGFVPSANQDSWLVVAPKDNLAERTGLHNPGVDEHLFDHFFITEGSLNGIKTVLCYVALSDVRPPQFEGFPLIGIGESGPNAPTGLNLSQNLAKNILPLCNYDSILNPKHLGVKVKDKNGIYTWVYNFVDSSYTPPYSTLVDNFVSYASAIDFDPSELIFGMNRCVVDSITSLVYGTSTGNAIKGGLSASLFKNMSRFLGNEVFCNFVPMDNDRDLFSESNIEGYLTGVSQFGDPESDGSRELLVTSRSFINREDFIPIVTKDYVYGNTKLLNRATATILDYDDPAVGLTGPHDPSLATSTIGFSVNRNLSSSKLFGGSK